MPLDAVCLAGVLQELKPELIGQRIEKIQQPARQEIILTFRGNRKLLLHAGAGQARIQFTSLPRENPASPPMFCMLLRKHLSGGKLLEIRQPGLERVVILTFSVIDELGETGERKLVLELMGRNANLILLGGDGRIIDCLRRVDLESSPDRQVLPGMFYRLPPTQDKLDPLQVSQEDLLHQMNDFPSEAAADQFLLDTFFGISPLICRELVYRTFGDTDSRLFSLPTEQRRRFAAQFSQWQDQIVRGHFTPYLLRRNGKPMDFSYFPILQYETAAEGMEYSSFSTLLDDYYETREQQERVRQKGQELQKCASTARDRLRRKLAVQEKELAETERREDLRIKGELITANLYRMERGMTCLEAENYYEESLPLLKIPLDPLLTPQENSARYFKQYQKAKTANRILAEQIAKGIGELDYLNSILDELSRCELEQDFNDVREELRNAGYLKLRGTNRKEGKRSASKPRVFYSTAGLTIYVGRSNRQNDQITKDASRFDLWFHTQKIHGSHVILRTDGTPPDQQSITEAAMLAAWFSQGRGGNQIPVDYTQIRNVRKPSGAKPGMVIYDPYQTAFVTPTEELVKSLSNKK